MNINTINIGHYRVTDNSGRSFELYNRNSGSVYTISMLDYAFIRHTNTEDRCDEICQKMRNHCGI